MFGWYGQGAALPGSNAADWCLNSKLIVMVGWTPSSTHWHSWQDQYYLILARERGTPIIYMDPRYATEAEVHADQWIPIKPGTDAAFFLAVAYILIRDDLYDKDYLDKYTYGFDRFKAYVIGHEDGLPKTPEWAENICGVPADTIEGFAQLYAESNPTYLKLHYGANRRSYGENLGRIAVTLQAMMGYIGVAGGFHTLMQGTAYGKPGSSAPSGRSPRNPDWPTPTMYRIHKWPKAVLLLKDVKKWKMSKKEYDRIVGNGNPEMGVPYYKMAFGTANGITTGAGNTNTSMEALRSLGDDGMFVCLQMHMTPDAKASDIVLPHTMNWEQDAVSQVYFAGFEALWWAPKIVEAQGEAKPIRWIWTQLAKRLGVLEEYNSLYTTDEEWDEAVRDGLQMGYENFEASMGDRGYDVPTWEEFKQEGVVVYDEYAIEEPWHYPIKEIIEADGLPKIESHKTGKIEIYNEWLATNDPMEPLKWGPQPQMSLMGYPLPPIPKYIPSPEAIDSPQTMEYPLTMLTSHSRHRMHASGFDNPMVRGEIALQRVWMNPSDARARGIADNDMVRIYNDVGEAVVPAYVTSRMAPGVVLLRHGAWFDPNPDGVDRVGCPNIFVHAYNKTPNAPANCTTIVEIQPFEGTGFRGDF
jgi:anaerobic dimethyl sulfoxide reductase subunit A